MPGIEIVDAPVATTLFTLFPFESLKETERVATSPDMYLALSKLAVYEAGSSPHERSNGADFNTVPFANVNFNTTPFCVPAVAAHACVPTDALETLDEEVDVAKLGTVTSVTVVPSVAPSTA
jgi:hypothetical protein